jgi:Xaa-Pro aminopeptidase
MTPDLDEFDNKRYRLARLCHDAGVAGVLLATQASFAWLTGGRTNRIDGSRDLGAGTLLATADGRIHILANTIEMPRLASEELDGFPVHPVEYSWTEEHKAADTVCRLARRVAGESERLAGDWPLPGVTLIDRAIARARVPLTPAEVTRYRALGRDAATAIEDMCRGLEPDLEEEEVARRASDALGKVGARAIVLLVGGDDRIAKFRHPVPTRARWQKTVLVAVCAQRQGLVAALSRIVSQGAVDANIAGRTRATAEVFASLLDATRPGVSGAELFAVAVSAYARAGFPGEEQRHHQGGATGYRSREWVAHPTSEERAAASQAFAWNPSITGTKIEDTAIVTDEGVELITATGNWPAIPVTVRGQQAVAADILIR